MNIEFTAKDFGQTKVDLSSRSRKLVLWRRCGTVDKERGADVTGSWFYSCCLEWA